ncbi:MAG: ABC transporter ATP-binding protein [Chloroflexaceae bacterium]|nr:ABC transporter ATP-binding protein [Chloroflexaceae bacterium]
MGFVIDGLDAEEYDRSYSDRALIRRITDYFKPHRGRMLLILLMVVLQSAVQTLLPLAIANGINTLAAIPTLTQIGMLTGAVVLIGVLGWIFNYVRQYQSAVAVGDVVLALREDAFDSVMQRDMSFYDKYQSGKVVSRVTSDTQDFSNVVTLTINLASELLVVVAVLVVLFAINPTLALITMLVLPGFALAALVFRKAARWATRRAQRMTAQLNATVREAISGIGVAKSFRQESAIYVDFMDVNKLTFRIKMQQGLVFSTIFPALDIVAAIGTGVVVYFGGLQVLSGAATAGTWYLFLRSLQIFYIPVTSIASFWSQFQQGLAASERVFALIDAESNVIQTANEPVDHLHGAINFRRVDFAYTPEVPVLQGFTLDVPAGQKLAVVGHTGAGKSSLIKLITRFYEFQGGTLLVDGRDIRRLDLSQYRPQIGLVPQSPFLFSGTVADNIRYGRQTASDAEVDAAARAIGGAWLDDLPEGLQTDVGERGARLSLGQRQLVALARVLLQNPCVFILDEATASIDPFTEAQIQDGLDVVMQGRTSIVIAHRLSTVRNADRIIVMQAGTIIEEGTHDTLLLQGGHYAELYTTYFRHQSIEYIEQVGAWSG